MDLSALLRELRGDRDVATVARELGVVRSAVYLWESTSHARRAPSPPNLQKLLDLYGASREQRLLAWRLRSGGDQAASAP